MGNILTVAHASTSHHHGTKLSDQRWEFIKYVLHRCPDEILDKAARDAGFQSHRAGVHEAREIIANNSIYPHTPPGRPVHTYTPTVLARAKALLLAEPRKPYHRDELLREAIPDGHSHDPGSFISALRNYLADEGYTLTSSTTTQFFLQTGDPRKRLDYSDDLLHEFESGLLTEEDLAFEDEIAMQAPPHPKSECMQLSPHPCLCT